MENDESEWCSRDNEWITQTSIDILTSQNMNEEEMEAIPVPNGSMMWSGSSVELVMSGLTQPLWSFKKVAPVISPSVMLTDMAVLDNDFDTPW